MRHMSTLSVIILTAKAQSSDREIGKEVKADMYVSKPFEADVLLQEIDKLLSP